MNSNVFLTGTESNLLIIDPSLDNKTAGLCDLIITVDESSVQLSLLEKKSNRFIGIEVFGLEKKEEINWKEYLESISAKSTILRKYEFSKVKICITSNKYTLVPEALLHPGDENSYFKMNFTGTYDVTIKSSHINAFSLFTVYGVDKKLIAELNHFFQDPKIMHHSEVLLQSSLRIGRTDSNKKLLLNIRKNEIDVLISEGKNLLLLNSFNRNSDEDVLYFTLFACEQLAIDTEKINVYLSGEIEAESNLYKLLFKYIRNLKFVGRDRTVSFGRGFDEIPAHYYFTLFNLPLCE